MSINYAINGRRFYGVQANWNRELKRSNNDGTNDYMPYAFHTWSMDVQHMTDYLYLQSLRGRPVNIVSTDIDDPDLERLYPIAELGKIECSHQGINPRSIEVSMMVRVAP